MALSSPSRCSLSRNFYSSQTFVLNGSRQDIDSNRCGHLDEGRDREPETTRGRRFLHKKLLGRPVLRLDTVHYLFWLHHVLGILYCNQRINVLWNDILCSVEEQMDGLVLMASSAVQASFHEVALMLSRFDSMAAKAGFIFQETRSHTKNDSRKMFSGKSWYRMFVCFLVLAQDWEEIKPYKRTASHVPDWGFRDLMVCWRKMRWRDKSSS